MKRIIIFIALAVELLFLAASCAPKNYVEIDKDVLLDKIKGGWAGQAIGCTYGGPTEFRYNGCIIPDTVEIGWPEHQMKWYYDNSPGLYDDIYMDLTFVDIFDRLGLDAPVDSFALSFANAEYPLWHANQQARYNILHGIMPPESGHWKNNPHADDIDFQIEADYAGLMSPGMPNTAAYYSDEIGHIMNYGDGWYGGVYVAAMYSLAFVSDDINYIVKEALKVIPEESRYYKCMSDIIRWHEEHPEDWKQTWQLCETAYNQNYGCPAGVSSSFNIDAVMNSAYVLIGLLYGQGDFDKTIDVATRCGQDSDCNPATAGGILATMLGYSNIPEKWLANLKEVEDRNFAYTDISLNRTYQMSFSQALQVISDNRGKVGEETVRIRTEEPEPVRFEQSFEGLMIMNTRNINKHAYGEDIFLEFFGSGITICGRLRNVQPDSDYVADIDIIVDGQKCEHVDLAEDHHARQEQIWSNFELEEGLHKLTVKVNNPREDKKVWIPKVIIYRNK